MGTEMSTRPKGIVVLGPAWYSCGSYEVFKRQMHCMRSLGFKTYFLAASPIVNIGSSNPYWNYYYSMTTDLGADVHAHTGRSRLFFRHAEFWKNLPALFGCSVARARTINAGLMSVPDSLKEFIAAHDIDTIICHHYFNIPLALKVRKLLPGAKLILETQDLQSNHYEKGNDVHLITKRRSTFAENLRDEMLVASQSDILIHYNEDETDVFREHMPQRPNMTVFPAFPRNYDELVKAGPAPEPYDFLIVASANDPNYHSICWFLENVWTPELDSRFDLRIAGNVDVLMTTRKNPLYDQYRTRFLGRVENLFELYQNARHVLLPVSEGQGISIKTIECLSFGKSMISTPLAFRGFQKRVPPDLFAEAATSATQMRDKILAADTTSPPKQDPRVSSLYETLFSLEAQTQIYRSLVLHDE
jgi:polysaccharide biosynthesis protein PslH